MNRPTQYILVNRQPVAESDVLTWIRWKAFAQDDCRVAVDETGDFYISTVFIGIDQNPFRRGAPLLFETMVQQRGRGWIHQERCATWREAEEQHKRICHDYRRHGEN
jgi:hypothetical protein